MDLQLHVMNWKTQSVICPSMITALQGKHKKKSFSPTSIHFWNNFLLNSLQSPKNSEQCHTKKLKIKKKIETHLLLTQH